MKYAEDPGLIVIEVTGADGTLTLDESTTTVGILPEAATSCSPG